MCAKQHTIWLFILCFKQPYTDKRTHIMLNRYNTQCEGCHGNVNIEAEGYIGDIQNVWCQNCGWEGEFLYEEEPQPQDESDRNIFRHGCMNENLLQNINLDAFDITEEQKKTVRFMISLFDNKYEDEYKMQLVDAIYTYMQSIGAYDK